MDGAVPDPKGYDVRAGYSPPRTSTPEARRNDQPVVEKAGEQAGGRDNRTEPDQALNQAADQEADQEAAGPPTPRWKKVLYWAIGLAVVAALAVAGVLYWLHARQYASTDDAYVQAYISQISPQVDGRVIELAVGDFEHVKAGQVLLRLDPRDYQVKLDQARAQRAQAAAQLAQAAAGLSQQQAAAEQAQANVRVAQADFGQAQADLARYRAVNPQAVTRQQVDTAGSSSKSAGARVEASRQAALAAQANVEAQKATIEAARANLSAADVMISNAELQLSYATVAAPRDGQAAKRTVNLGDYVKAGQSLLAVVGDERWVLANYKETDLAGMAVGQPVTMGVDACPSHRLGGQIDSFQPGSGSIFSSLPPENATGNFVKVVQRVPVKITLNGADVARCRLSPGLSVVPSVKVR